MRAMFADRLATWLGRPVRRAAPHEAPGTPEPAAAQESLPGRERGLPAEAYPIDATGWGTGGWPWP
jgi:hypothetical protein